MPTRLETVTEEVLKLPFEHRVVLLDLLLASLPVAPNPSVESEHLRDIYERQAAAEQGKVEFIDGPEALSRARKHLKERGAHP